MSDLYVADILKARPSLRHRAKDAAKLAYDAECVRRDAQEEQIIRETRGWLRDELGCNDEEINRVQFTRGPYNSDGSQRQVTFSIDGVMFKAALKHVKTDSYNVNGREKSLYDDTLEVRASGSGATWVVVESLADVGKLIP